MPFGQLPLNHRNILKRSHWLSTGRFSGKLCEKGVVGTRKRSSPKNDGADGLLAFDDVTLGSSNFVKNGAGTRKEGLAKFREADGAAEPVEESRAEFALEFQDLLGKRRLGDMTLPGGTGEGTVISDGTEVTQLVKFHAEILGDRRSAVIGNRFSVI
jgi:hypothetical protein